MELHELDLVNTVIDNANHDDLSRMLKKYSKYTIKQTEDWTLERKQEKLARYFGHGYWYERLRQSYDKVLVSVTLYNDQVVKNCFIELDNNQISLITKEPIEGLDFYDEFSSDTYKYRTKLDIRSYTSFMGVVKNIKPVNDYFECMSNIKNKQLNYMNKKGVFLFADELKTYSEITEEGISKEIFFCNNDTGMKKFLQSERKGYDYAIRVQNYSVVGLIENYKTYIKSEPEPSPITIATQGFIDEIEEEMKDEDEIVFKKEEKTEEKMSKSSQPDLMDLFAEQIKSKMGIDNINEAKIINLVQEEVKKHYIPQQIIVKQQDKPAIDVGVTHAKFKDLLKLVEKRIDTFLVGQAGSGKTTLCSNVAKSLDLPFYFIPVGLQTTKSDLLGYMDATGKYIQTHLRNAYENGGVFLLDEIDAGNPNVLTVINAMLANHHASFPDKIITRHDNFIFIAAGNTYGLGSDIQYVGRNQLDAATLDRFVILEINYDKSLEAHMCNNDDWLKTVWAIRKAAKRLNEKIIVSPRASLKGAMMLESGFSKEDVKRMAIYKGINQEIVKRIEAEVSKGSE